MIPRWRLLFGTLLLVAGCTGASFTGRTAPAPSDTAGQSAPPQVTHPIISPIEPQDAGPTATSIDSPGPGCGHITIPTFDDSFVPVDERFGHRWPIAILDDGEPISSLDADVGFPPIAPASGAWRDPLVLILLDKTEGDTGVRLFYASSPVEKDESPEEFYARGGVSLKERIANGQDAAFVKETLGDFAATVDLGPHPATLVHADPLENGFRPWQLYWSDGIRDLSMVGGVDQAADLVALARSMYCT